MRYSVLDWHQEPTARAQNFMAAPDAEALVKRLAAEKIRKGVIRMFSPDSVFYALRPIAPQVRFIPTKLPPVEVECCKFIPPITSPQPSVAAIRERWDWSKDALPAWVMPPQAEPLYA